MSPNAKAAIYGFDISGNKDIWYGLSFFWLMEMRGTEFKVSCQLSEIRLGKIEAEIDIFEGAYVFSMVEKPFLYYTLSDIADGLDRRGSFQSADTESRSCPRKARGRL